jgi:ATP-dependent Clp protease ATP-binding subunit ClpA
MGNNNLMDINSFTLKSQEVLSRAEQDALAQGHTSIETLHVLGAMMSVEDPVIPMLLGRMNVPVGRIQQAVSAALSGLDRNGPATLGRCYNEPWRSRAKLGTNTWPPTAWLRRCSHTVTLPVKF